MTGSLGDLTTFTADAHRLLPAVPFRPEDVVIGSYTFLPWVRGGVGAVVHAADGALRATLDVAVPVQSAGPELTAAVSGIQVRGPGDVLGLDERQVVRRYPEPGATDAEDSFLAHVEFDRPVVPWLFSPTAAAGDRLTPWIALVVLEQGRYSLRPGAGGRPDRVDTVLGELQQTDDAWAWAHAQLVGPLSAGSVADRLTPAYGPTNLSRLLCPRRLEPERQYLAAVVPLYNAGVATGLGAPLPAALAPAWTRAADGSDADVAVTLPVYTSWRFGTAPAGDFGSLAGRLRGVPAPWQVGRRITDMSAPGGGLPALAGGDPGRLQTVRAAVYSPNPPDAGSADPTEVAALTAETARWSDPQTAALRAELNRPAALAGTTAALGDPVPRPVVGPEIYDRYQAAASRVEPDRDGDWFGELNLDPRNRVAAGLGARVVQKDQEQLMQSAWAQVGEVDALNRALRWAQLARHVGVSSHARHVAPLSFGDLLAVTRRVQTRVLAAPAVTVAADVGASRLADGAVTAAFRRVTRPLGGLARFAAADPAAHARLVADGAGVRDLQRPYVELDGVDTVSAAAIGALDAARVAPVLGGDPTAVGAALAAAATVLAERPPPVDDLARAVGDRAPDDPGGAVLAAAADLLDRLERTAEKVGDAQPAWSVAAAGLAQAVGVVPQLADRAQVVARRALAGVEAQAPGAASGLATVLRRGLAATPAAVTEGFGRIAGDLVSPDWPATPVRPDVVVTPPALLGLVDPAVTLTARMRARVGRPGWLPTTWFDDLLLNPVLAAPHFTRPMYEALDDYSRDWLLPGLHRFPAPDVVTVLQSNPAFVEGFLGGLSHEMGRELLWRGYPTDQRGTYFRRFWNRAKDDLTQDLAAFTPTALGSHLSPTLSGIVLMVRGEVIRRYPHAVVLAMRAGSVDAAGVPTFEDPVAQPGTLAGISFHGHLPPDIVLVGFELTVADVAAGSDDGVGWWFLVAEHPTAPRFGLHDGPVVPEHTRDDLTWAARTLRHGRFLDGLAPVPPVPDVTGGPATASGTDAAAAAHVLLRDPVRAAFYGRTLLKGTGALR